MLKIKYIIAQILLSTVLKSAVNDTLTKENQLAGAYWLFKSSLQSVKACVVGSVTSKRPQLVQALFFLMLTSWETLCRNQYSRERATKTWAKHRKRHMNFNEVRPPLFSHKIWWSKFHICSLFCFFTVVKKLKHFQLRSSTEHIYIRLKPNQSTQFTAFSTRTKSCNKT